MFENKEVFPQVRRLVEEKTKQEDKTTTEQVTEQGITPFPFSGGGGSITTAKTKRKSKPQQQGDSIPNSMARLASLVDSFVVRIVVDRSYPP